MESITPHCKLYLLFAAMLLFAGAAFAGPQTTISIITPADAFNTTSLAQNITINFTSNESTALNCTIFLNGTAKNTSNTLNVTNTILNITYTTDSQYSYYFNCTGITPAGNNDTNVSATRTFKLDTSAPNANNLTIYDPDQFYSAFTGNDIINITANFTDLGDIGSLTVIANCNATMNHTYNITKLVWNGRAYSGTCNATAYLLNLTYVANPAPYTIQINATDVNGNKLDNSSTTVTVLFHNLNVPSMGATTCSGFGGLTTNFSRVLNFNAINLNLEQQINGSATCMGTALPWGEQLKTVMLLNFTSVDMSTQEKAQRVFGNLSTAINISINRPRTFGSSRIFVNSSQLAELNTTTNLTFYDLPFAAFPYIVSDPGVSATVTYGWAQGPYNATYGTATGNLSLKVTSFSGYNISDNVTPVIAILQPVNTFNSTTTTNITINVTINGTGTQLSMVDINFTYSGTTLNFTYNNATGSNTANCTYAALGSENLTCFMTAGVGYGYWQVNVTAVDYGGVAGNTNTSTITVNLLGATTAVSLVSPANASNTTSLAGNFTFNFTSNVTAMNCSLFIDASRVTYYDNVTNNSNYILNATYSANRTHTWYVNCTNTSALSNGNVSASWNFTHASLAERNVTVYDTDLFYSAFSGNNIINISANFSGTGDAGSLVVMANCSNVANYTYNITRLIWDGRTYSGNCTAITHLLNQSYRNYIPVSYTIPINVTGATANDVLSTTLTVYLHNLNQPSLSGTCFRFSADSTNMSRVTNFSNVTLGLGYEVEGSATCQGTALPWGETWKLIGRMNWSGFDITNPNNAAKFENLTVAVANLTMHRPGAFGSSRVYVNSASYSFLNSTANISFYDLPFAGYPYIIADADSRGTVTYGWVQGPFDTTYGRMKGNLSLKITSFSGYNISDNVTPVIAILQPVNTFNSTTTTNITINVTINGTGTQLSMVDINFTYSGTTLNFTYNNATGSNTANCTYAALGSENLTCFMTAGVGYGYWQVNVTAVDYGGAAGNTNTSTITVNLIGASTVVSLVSPANASNTTSLAGNFTFNFTSNVTAMNCSLFIDASRIIYDNVTNNTNYTFNASFSANRTHTWYVNCTNASALSNGNVSASWNFMQNSQAPSVSNVTVYDTDLFYSAFTGNDIINISANFSGLDDPGSLTVIANCSQVMNYAYNITRLVWDGRTYSGTCNATTFLTNLSSANYVPRVYNISINATGTGGVLLTTNLSVYFYHLNYPTSAGTCFRFRADSTNLTRVTNFSGVALGLGYEVNGSAACQTTALPWNDSWKTVARVNYTGFDITNPNNAAKFENLTISVVNVTVNAPRTFGNSRVYVNSGSFSFLNSTANITFYDLPFAAMPSVRADADSQGTVTYGWVQGPYNDTYRTLNGNLSVKITSFTGYNVTDNATPTITVIHPTITGFNTTNTNVSINVTVNGTGTQLSLIDINLTDGISSYNFTFNNATGSNTANCSYAAAGSENASCKINAAVANGHYNITITAVDYGSASGNQGTSSLLFVSDNSTPTLVQNKPQNNSQITNTNVTIGWTATDAVLQNITCNLTIDGQRNGTNFTMITVTNNTMYNTTVFNLTGALLAYGNHNWSVQCWDGLNNLANSSNFTFTIHNITTIPQGNASNVNNISAGLILNVTVNGSGPIDGGFYNVTNGTVPIQVFSQGGLVLSFNYNLSNTTLNFSRINISIGTPSGASAKQMYVHGVNLLGGQVGKKNFTIYGSHAAFDGICVKNVESASSTSLSCNGDSETALKCNGTAVGGITCTKSGETLSITGLNHSVVTQFDVGGGGASGGSGGQSGGGGGGGGGGSSATETSTSVTLTFPSGQTCNVTVRRELSSSPSLSVLTVTLTNTGGTSCNMENAVFTDTIPTQYADISEMSFSPAYTTVDGQAVSFAFPTFNGGESRTLSYSVSRFVQTSRLTWFGVPGMSASLAAPPVAPPTAPSVEEEQPAAEEGQPSAEGEQVPSQRPTEPVQPTAPQAPQAGGGLLAAGAATVLGVLIVLALIAGGVYFFVIKKRKKGL